MAGSGATAATPTGAASAATGRAPLWLRCYESLAYQFRRTWRGVALTSTVIPLLNLLALGYGLGILVNERAGGSFGGVGYAAFVAGGLVAANAMQTATDESMWPVMSAIKWQRTYHAMIATPLAVRSVLVGQVAWIATRVALAAGIFVVIVAALGLTEGPAALLALPAAVLTGLAFSLPIIAFSARSDNDSSFAYLYRFGIVPLFLFSGTFFPIAQLPSFLQVAAALTPLYHGVELTRGAVLAGAAGADDLPSVAVHAGVLLLYAGVGAVLADRTLRSRLLV